MATEGMATEGMATEGFEGYYIETRNYGATAAFWASMGFMTETLTAFWADGIIPLIAGG